MNTGHTQLACVSCHRAAPGTLRQQLQANARFWLGLRSTPADFGKRPVENSDCVTCHERPFDRHPVTRFNEPRFASARKHIAPQNCQSCHREHSGVRVTASLGFCENCHAKLKLESDPLDVSHDTLIGQRRWESCLGCHDFHGNHVFTPPREVERVTAAVDLEYYFQGGSSPYPQRLRSQARSHREDP
jgi:hypothetical protein